MFLFKGLEVFLILKAYWLGSWKQVRVADPTFLGYFIDKGVASAAKVVRKVTTIRACIRTLIILIHCFYQVKF